MYVVDAMSSGFENVTELSQMHFLLVDVCRLFEPRFSLSAELSTKNAVSRCVGHETNTFGAYGSRYIEGSCTSIL